MHAAPTAPAPHEHPPAIGATILMGAAALLVMGIQPILLGGLAEQGLLTQAGVGYAATLELFGFAIGASIGPFAMNGSLRLKAFAASTALTGLNLSIYLASTSMVILAERTATGVLEGLLMGAASVVLTHTSRPERMNGLLLGLGTAPQIAVAYLLPALLIPRFGLNSGFVILAITAALAAITSYWLPDGVETQHENASGAIRWTPGLVGMAIVVVLQNAGCGAAWSYLERLAHQQGLTPTIVGTAIASSLTVQVAGALLAAWISWRLPSRAILIFANALAAALTFALTLTGSSAAYILFTCLFGLSWLAQQPFQVTQLIGLDPTRKVAVLLTPLALIGLSIGPVAAAAVMSATDVRPGFWAAAALLTLAAVVLLLPRHIAMAASAPT